MTHDQYRMFIGIDPTKLRPSQWAVQASHAMAEFSFKHGALPSFKTWVQEHKTLIILSLDQKDFDDLILKSQISCIEYSIFTEPDLDNYRTAIAFEPIIPNRLSLFRKYPLLGKPLKGILHAPT